MGKKDYGAIIFTPYELFKRPENKDVIKSTLISKYKTVSNSDFDNRWPNLSGGFGVYDFYTKNDKIINENIFVPRRALNNPNELYPTLIHENFHKTERHLSKLEYNKIDGLDKSRLLNDFYNKLKLNNAESMPRSQYMNVGKKLSNHEILAEYLAAFPESVGAPSNYIERILNRVMFMKKVW